MFDVSVKVVQRVLIRCRGYYVEDEYKKEGRRNKPRDVLSRTEYKIFEYLATRSKARAYYQPKIDHG